MFYLEPTIHKIKKGEDLHSHSNQMNSEDSSLKNTGVPSIEEKRRKGRLRSKCSRDRRRKYVSNLEEKVKSLENENFRLQSIIMKYRMENWENVDECSKSFIEKSIEHKRKMLSRFMDLETMEFRNNPDFSLLQNFKDNYLIALEKHRKFLDGAFEVIINHPYPVSKYAHWVDLETEYTSEFSLLKKYKKMSKYQAEEFKEKYDFSKVDEMLLSMNPNKRQFDFVK